MQAFELAPQPGDFRIAEFGVLLALKEGKDIAAPFSPAQRGISQLAQGLRRKLPELREKLPRGRTSRVPAPEKGIERRRWGEEEQEINHNSSWVFGMGKVDDTLMIQFAASVSVAVM